VVVIAISLLLQDPPIAHQLRAQIPQPAAEPSAQPRFGTPDLAELFEQRHRSLDFFHVAVERQEPSPNARDPRLRRAPFLSQGGDKFRDLARARPPRSVLPLGPLPAVR